MKQNPEKALRYLGLAARAGKVIIGVEECRKAAVKQKNSMMILAQDAAENARKRAEELTTQYNIPLLTVHFSKQQLGDSIGKAKPVALVMVTDKNLVNAITMTVQNDDQQEGNI